MIKKKKSPQSKKIYMGRPPLPRADRFHAGPRIFDRLDVLARCEARRRATGQSIAAQYREAMRYWELQTLRHVPETSDVSA